MNHDLYHVRTYWWLFAAAALSMTITFAAPYVGEEGVYTITSMEMRLNRDYFTTTLFGNNYGRPPLLNWLVIGLSEMLGWERVLPASRCVTAFATVATGLVVAWLTFNLSRDRLLAAFSALVYLSGDVLFYRGWLAYADSLFTLFVFGAIACLWVAVARSQARLLWLAVALITCGFLTKVQTAYLFYVVAFVVLCSQERGAAFLLRANSIAAHGAGIAALLAWNAYSSHGTQSGSTLTDIVLKVRGLDIGDYLVQLGLFPLETLLGCLPATALAGYYAWSRRHQAGSSAESDFPWRPLIAMLALNYLPYWLGPQTHIRYIMPLYPLIAIALAVLIWRFGKHARVVATRWLAVGIVLKYAVALWLFPWYQENHRGDYARTAAQILAITEGYPLYTTDVSATGLSVAAHIDAALQPRSYLHWPPPQWDDGYVLSYTPDVKLGQTTARFALGTSPLYLLCRGVACMRVAGRPNKAVSESVQRSVSLR